ncbi:MAG TPA: mechanosensitive ion channel domain-containing protein [Chitinophagaceae bacterium]|jgi:MscS family membrane protein|nr:mechanosensitive ion channel domain-containing protein [Chitinophagaceae bacterium]
MNDFFSRLYFDNEVRDYCISLGIILFILLLNRVISKYFAGLIFSFVKRIWKSIDKKTFTDLVIHPLGMFVIVLAFIIALHRLHFPGRWDVEIYRYTVRDIFHAVGTTVLIISFIWLLLRMIDFIATILEKKADLTEDPADNQLIVFFKDFFKVLLGIAGILMILHFAFNLHIGNLLTGLSIVGAAIALSLRESLENLIASFVIFFDKPFSTGDLVKVQNITGTVEKIGLRSTRIRTDQKTFVTVPNKQMVDSILDNLSLRTQRKGELKLEIDLNTPSQKIEEFLNGIKIILKKKEVESSSILMDAIAGNAFMINGDYFTAPVTQNEFNNIKEEINLSLLKLMESLEIQIAGANKDIRIIAQEKMQ